MTTPPDPYMLKIVETATKTTIEIIHEDIKAGMKGLISSIQERGKEKAIQNTNQFEKALESDISARMISIGISPNSHERIRGNLNDPDFAYMLSQATIASGRTSSEEKHKLLARAVTERLVAEPESLVALASGLACEIIPNLTASQLSFLGLLNTATSLRPKTQPELSEESEEIQQKTYIEWLEKELSIFLPFPNMRFIDYAHLQGMSCIEILQIGMKSFHDLLKPSKESLPKFRWPEKYLETNELIRNLNKIDGFTRCNTTTIGRIIGIHVHDIKRGNEPTEILW